MTKYFNTNWFISSENLQYPVTKYYKYETIIEKYPASCNARPGLYQCASAVLEGGGKKGKLYSTQSSGDISRFT